jgi:toxin YxiD
MGGHTLQRHVGKTDADLIERLAREPQISSASTYTDRATAERIVGAALQSGNRAFAAWRDRNGRRPNFVLRYHADRIVGRSIARGHATSVPCDRALIVLRWDERRGRYYVLTSYPEAGR